MNAIRREWREGKVRPIPGNSPHDRLVSRGIIPSLRRICDDPFPTTHSFSATATNHTRRPVCVFKAWRNLSGPMWFQNQNQTPGRGRAASRWSAPSPGKRTRREDHAPSHRPQMSSGRLFLDRVARQQGPSPLHRHPQINTHSQGVQAKGDISTLPGRRHFYFALTLADLKLTARRFLSILTSFVIEWRNRKPRSCGTSYARGTGIDASGTAGGAASGLVPNFQNWGVGLNVTFPLFDLPSIRARKERVKK